CSAGSNLPARPSARRRSRRAVRTQGAMVGSRVEDARAANAVRARLAGPARERGGAAIALGVPADVREDEGVRRVSQALLVAPVGLVARHQTPRLIRRGVSGLSDASFGGEMLVADLTS